MIAPVDISVGDMRQSSAEKVSLVDTAQGQSSAFNMTNVKEARGEKTGVYIALALPIKPPRRDGVLTMGQNMETYNGIGIGPYR